MLNKVVGTREAPFGHYLKAYHMQGYAHQQGSLTTFGEDRDHVSVNAYFALL
jgi:hypothetical protein